MINDPINLDPIIGVDVTDDGTYILATCKTYLLLICTELKESNVTGFVKAMGEQKVNCVICKRYFIFFDIYSFFHIAYT
jgi:hypothetical protein